MFKRPRMWTCWAAVRRKLPPLPVEKTLAPRYSLLGQVNVTLLSAGVDLCSNILRRPPTGLSHSTLWEINNILDLLLPAATKLGQGNKFTGVCLSTRGGGRGRSPIWGGVRIFRGGCLKFSRGSEFFGGCLNFSGGVSPIFFSFFFQFLFPQKISSGMHPPETVNARPVRILLECILVSIFKFLLKVWSSLLTTQALQRTTFTVNMLLTRTTQRRTLVW